jgi:hypothetical protein
MWILTRVAPYAFATRFERVDSDQAAGGKIIDTGAHPDDFAA